jgi:zinc protease
MTFPPTTATVHTLPNGLTLILDPHHDHPVISTQLWVETGSIHENQLLGAGLSHFLEHMVFKGTAAYDGTALASVVQAAGGHWNAYTTFDRTVYYIDGPATGVEKFLHVLTEMVYRPTLPEDEFEMEKDVIRREIDMGLDDPSQAGMRLLLDTAFRHDPRRLPVIGYRASFDAITHQDLVSYHRERYTTNRTFFVLSGDFDSTEAIAMITKLTADLQPGPAREPFYAIDPPQCSLRQAADVFAIPSSRLCLAWKIPAMGHPDAPIYDVLAAMLGRGQSSHLYTELREKQELALEIAAWSWSGNIGDGLFAISAECQPEQRERLIAAIREEMIHYQQVDFTEALERAKRQIMVSQFRSLTTASGRAADLAGNWHEARDLQFTKNYLALIEQVDAAAVLRCLRDLDDRKLTITQLNPLSEANAKSNSVAPQSKVAHQSITLRNGIKVALFPDSRLPILSLQTVVRGGLSRETAEIAGISSLLASTLTQGTTSRSAYQISSTLDRLGASLHASTGNNSVLLHGSCLTPDLDVLLGIWSDVLLHPTFPEDSLLREKASQLSSIRESLEDPLDTAFHQMRGMLFSGKSYGVPAIGTVESITSIQQSDLIHLHRELFCAQNMTIALAGDFDPARIIPLLEEHLAPLPSGKSLPLPPSELAHDRCETFHREKKQAVIAIGYPGLSAADPRRFASSMLLEYCSDMAGPLFTRIREELGLAYQVGATQFHGHDVGMVAFYVSTAPEQLALAHSELISEIAKIADQGIPDAEFENVRATVLSALVLQQQSPGAIARQAAVDLLFDLPADHHRHVHEIIRQLTPQDIRNLARDLFQEVKPVTALVTQQQATAII